MIPQQQSRIIKWIFPDEHPQKIKQIPTFQEFQQETGKLLRKYDRKIVPFIREDSRYYHLKKYEEKMINLFNPSPDRRSQSDQQHSRKSIRKNSISKAIDAIIEFKYKPEYETEEKLKLIKAKMEKNDKELSTNLEKYGWESYYINLRMQKNNDLIKKNAHMKRVKIIFFISEPLVKTGLDQNKKQAILKEQVKIYEHRKLIKSAYENKNACINLSMDKLFLSSHKLDEFIKYATQKVSASDKEQTFQSSTDLVIVQIYTEIVKKDDQFYVVMESETNIGEEDNTVSLATFMRKINQIPKLYTVILIGPSMRELKAPKSKLSLKVGPHYFADRLPSRIVSGNFKLQSQTKPSNQTKPSSQTKPQLVCTSLHNPSLVKKQSNNFQKPHNLQEKQFKQWHWNIRVPVITLNVFDPESDFFRKIFLSYFYEKIFKRVRIFSCFDQSKKQIKKIVMKDYEDVSECCCLHTQNTYNPIWKKLVSIIGKPTIHKIFHHQSSSMLNIQIRKGNDELIKAFLKFILKNRLSQVQLDLIDFDDMFPCRVDQNNHFFHRCGRDDLMIFNKQLQNDDCLPMLKQGQYWQAGQMQSDKIPNSKLNRYRPLVMYQIINMIRQKQKFGALGIAGPSKSGKSLFINLVQEYLVNRYNNLKCEKFKDWLKFFRLKTHLKVIKKKIQQAKKNITYDCFLNVGQSATLSLNLRNKKFIFILGKINSEVKEQFKKFILDIRGESQINSQNLLLIFSLGELTSQFLRDSIQIYPIPPLNDEQIKYTILKDPSIRINSEKQVRMLDSVVAALKEQRSSNLINQIDFPNFCRELMKIISQMKIIQDSKDRMKCIEEKIKNYNHKGQKFLKQIKQNDKNFWHTIEFLCSFKDGFYLCDFNMRMAIQEPEHFQKLKQKQFQSQYILRILEHSRSPGQRSKTFSIQPEIKCHKYFKELQSKQLFNRKVNYFFNFYYLVYCLIKTNQFEYSSNYQRVFAKLGIFMYDFEPKLQQILRESNDQQFLKQQSKKIRSQNEKNIIFNEAIQKHVYIYIKFLEEYIDQGKQDLKDPLNQKIMFLIVYSMLFAALCYRYLDDLVGNKKQLLQKNMQLIISNNKDVKDQNLIILFAQIRSYFYVNLTGDEEIMESEDKIECTRAVLKYLKQYEHFKYEIFIKKKKLQKLQAQANKDLLKNIQSIVDNIKKREQRLRNVFKVLVNQKEKQEKCHQCLMDLLITKILVKFLYLNQMDEKNKDSVPDLNISILKKELEEAKSSASFSYDPRLKYKYNEGTIQLCELYLKIKTNIEACKDSDIDQVNTKAIPKEFRPLQQYIKRKLNPKTLFKSSNIALFMKAGCFQVDGLDYNFVRMNNVISAFLSRKLSSSKLNLLFMNLSIQNFETVSFQSPQVIYFVLSADCILNNNKQLEVIFEDNSTCKAKKMLFSAFTEKLRKIKCQFLILFGSYSIELKEKIYPYLSKENICIIALTMKKQKLDLSTYPQFQSAGRDPTPLEIVEKFVKVQNSQRLMEMTISCLIALLAKESNKKVLKEYVEENIVKQSIAIGKKILKSWYQNVPHIEKYVYDIHFSVHVQKPQALFPHIMEGGELANLTREIVPTPINFKDDDYYENVGRTSLIQSIMHRLVKDGKMVIEIVGGSKNGKTQLLKQIGWFCQTRKIFEQGVYRYDIKQLIGKGKVNQILEHLDKQSTKNKLLILLDNCEPEFIQENNSTFSYFFDRFQKKSMSLVYTMYKEAKKGKQFQTRNENILINFEIKNLLSEAKCKSQIFSTSIDQISDVEKICIALIKIRNRRMAYKQILQKYFRQLCGLKIKKSDSLPSTHSVKGSRGKSGRPFKNKQSSIFGNNNKNPKSEQNQFLSTPSKLQISRSLVPQNQPDESNQLQKMSLEFIRSSTVLAKIKQERAEEEQEQVLIYSRLMTRAFSEATTPGILTNRLDISGILQLCQQYKRKLKEEKRDGMNNFKDYEIYEQSYLNFDVEHMIQELEDLDGLKLEITNPMYFQRYDYYKK